MTANIANADRFVHYTPNNSTGPFPVPFPVFDPTGADLEVTLNGQVVTSGWSFTGTLEPGFYGAPNTWVNGSISFDAPISGSLYIEGNRAPRRPAEAQFAEGRGVPARDHNTEYNILTATDRELYQKLRRTIMVPVGDDGVTLPPKADRANRYLGFDGAGRPVALEPNTINTPDLADGSVTDAKIAGELVTYYATLAEAISAHIPSNRRLVRVGGYAAPGDGGGALYRRVLSEPAHAGKIQSADGSWWEIVEDPLRPEMFGAFAGDTPANVRAGFDAMMTVVAAKGAKWVLDRAYDIGTGGPAFWAGNCIASAGAALRGNVYLGSVTGLSGKPIKVDYDDGVARLQYKLDPAALYDPTEIDGFLTAGEAFSSKYEAVDMSAVETSYWMAGSSDTFVPEAPDTKTSDTIVWELSGNTGLWHIAWCPVTGGDEVSAAFSRGDFLRGVWVLTTAGFEYLYAPPDSTIGLFGVKPEGLVPSETVYPIFGAVENVAYRFRNAEITVRVQGPKTFSILANGSEIVDARDTHFGGQILAVGFGVFEDGTHTASLKNMVRARKAEQHGLLPVYVGILGNSISIADMFGGWDKWLQKYLDFSMGTRLRGLTNLAESGVGSDGILAQSEDSELAPCNVVLIVAPGTNDTQLGVPVATTVSNISAAIDNIVNAGKKCILFIEPMWYSADMVAGYGMPTQNHERGAERRTALRRLAATKGIGCVDLQQVSGFIDAGWVGSNTIDPTLRDNIHPSALFFKVMAKAAARAILEAYAPKPTRAIAYEPIPTSGAYSWLGTDFTASAWPLPRYSVTASGEVSLVGHVIHGGTSSPAHVLTVPPGLRPPHQIDVTLSMYDGVSNSLAFGVLGANGELHVYAVPTGATLRLDNLRWVLPD